MLGIKRRRKNNTSKLLAKNKISKQWLNWKQMVPQEGSSVVKGLSRRVIVVKSPDKRYFDEAIFVLKDELFNSGADSTAVIREARKAANCYLKMQPKVQKKSISKFPPHLFMLVGTTALLAARFL